LETQEKKTTETEAHSPLATVYACTTPDGRFPAKSTNQIKVRVAHAHVHRQIPARAPQGSWGI